MLDKNVTSTCDPSLLQIYADNRHILVRFAIRLTGCGSYAEDIVQDAFFRLPSAPKITSSAKAQLSYIFQIVRNLSVDHHRKQTLIKKHLSSKDIDADIDNISPETTYRDVQTLNQIDVALADLPDRTRYAFERHRIHGVAQKEIAKELGVSNTLVNFMIRDALIHCNKSINTD